MMLVNRAFVAEMTAADLSADPIIPGRWTLAIKGDLTSYAVIASLTAGRESRAVQGIRDRHGYEACRLLNRGLRRMVTHVSGVC